MDTKSAVQNLDNLIASSRLTRQEHIALSQSLDHLAKLAQNFEIQQEVDKEVKEDGESTE